MRSGILAVIAAAALFACSGESTSSNSGATGDLTTDADGSVLAAFGAGAWLGGVGADGIGGVGHLGWRRRYRRRPPRRARRRLRRRPAPSRLRRW